MHQQKLVPWESIWSELQGLCYSMLNEICGLNKRLQAGVIELDIRRLFTDIIFSHKRLENVINIANRSKSTGCPRLFFRLKMSTIITSQKACGEN
jgi:hypothetical protein